MPGQPQSQPRPNRCAPTAAPSVAAVHPGTSAGRATAPPGTACRSDGQPLPLKRVPQLKIEEAEIAPEVLLDLQIAAIRHHGHTAYGPDAISVWCEIAREEATAETFQGFRTYVASVDGNLCGFCCFSAEEAFIGSLYVAPPGVGLGVGTMLLAAAEEAARRHRLARLTVYSSLNAVPFYQRRGFRPTADTTVEHSSGIRLPMVQMEKPLLYPPAPVA